MAFALRRAPVSRKNQAKWGHNITEMECVNLIARGDGDNRRHGSFNSVVAENSNRPLSPSFGDRQRCSALSRPPVMYVDESLIKEVPVEMVA